MVFENNCTQMILSAFPQFASSERWKKNLEFWGNEDPGLCENMSQFSNFIREELNNPHSTVDFKKVFDFIESLLINGDQTVQDAAATCFLESLINSSSWDRIKPSQFIHFLGPESREYCKAWDEFTGVKTDGLWD